MTTSHIILLLVLAVMILSTGYIVLAVIASGPHIPTQAELAAQQRKYDEGLEDGYHVAIRYWGKEDCRLTAAEIRKIGDPRILVKPQTMWLC